jgi:hypothetical protein
VSDDRVSADDVLTLPLPDPGYVVTSAVVVVAAVDPETGEEHMFHRHDSDAGVWKHIGMLRVALNDLEDSCRERE